MLFNIDTEVVNPVFIHATGLQTDIIFVCPEYRNLFGSTDLLRQET
jgi:hypothetical protein